MLSSLQRLSRPSLSHRLLSSSDNLRFDLGELKMTIERILAKAGFSQYEVEVTSSTLLYAEFRGNNQGIIKILSG